MLISKALNHILKAHTVLNISFLKNKTKKQQIIKTQRENIIFQRVLTPILKSSNPRRS